MRTVLIVEDDGVIRSAIAEMLRDEGYVVHTAANGEEGLHAIGEHRPDLAIVDLMMPVMDGWELLRRQRSDPDLASIPTLVLSASTTDGMEAAKQLGATAFLPKPYDIDALAAMADQLSRSSYDRARFEGALLVVRTVAHRLNNQLALTVGYGELLASHSDLPEHLRVLAREAHQGAIAASETISLLQQVTRIEEVEFGGQILIDIERSVE